MRLASTRPSPMSKRTSTQSQNPTQTRIVCSQLHQHPFTYNTIMGVSKRTRKFGAVKRIIGQRDARLLRQDNRDINEKKKATETIVREVPQVSSSLFFQYNTALVPPYSVLIDSNFLSHTVQRKLPLLETMMDTLFAKCIPVITSCGPHSLLPFSLLFAPQR